MMSEMLGDARRRGEPIAGLIASESAIYGRFGFGHATDRVNLTIDTRGTRFRFPVARVDLDLIDRDEAAKVLPEIFDGQRRGRAGEPNRAPEFWELELADRPHRRAGGQAAFIAVCEGGYVRYRAFEGDYSSPDLHRLVVEDLRANTPEIEAALWDFVFNLDLIGSVTAKRRPVDEPVRWRLADPRQLLVTGVTDFLWLRILDVPAALEARGYRSSGRLVLDLRPPLVDEGGADPAPGKWVLEAGPDGSSCRAASAGDEVDLGMEITELGSLYLGGFSATLLAAAGRIEELRPGALDVADGLFATSLAPFTGTGF
jgi:predicted acetyltransferase